MYIKNVQEVKIPLNTNFDALRATYNISINKRDPADWCKYSTRTEVQVKESKVPFPRIFLIEFRIKTLKLHQGP